MASRSRIRLGSWTAPLVALVLAILTLSASLTIIYVEGENIIDAQAQREASDESAYLVALAQEEGLSALVATVDRRERTHGGTGFRYALTDRSGHPLAGAPALSSVGTMVKGWKVVELPTHGRQVRWHVLVDTLPSGANLVVAQDAKQRTAFKSAIFQASAFALVLAALGCTAIGIVMNRLLVKRVDTIAHTAARIAAGDLGARVNVATPGDVFDDLGASLNQMMARIEELVNGMRTVTDSVAHDVRTPLMRLKAALSRAGAADADENTRQEALERAHAEADIALSTFSALLDISRAESGLSEEAMQDSDIAALVREVSELFEPVFEDQGQKLNLIVTTGPVIARVHALLLRQAVGNLLHNAAKYAGKGANVQVRLENKGHTREIIVADNGPGIAEADRGRVQERFVKLDSTRGSPGAGLGLAIVAACAKLHKGALRLEDNAPGLRAVLEISAESSGSP